MKIVLLFMVTIMVFFLYLVPLIWPFTSSRFLTEAIGFAYFGWYLMIFILTLEWGDVVRKKWLLVF